MKVKYLRKGKYVIFFPWFYSTDEYYEACNCLVFIDNNKFYLFAPWDYDNGLYVDSGEEQVNIPWKWIKWNLSHYDEKPKIYKWNNKCIYCHKPIEFKRENFDSGQWIHPNCEAQRFADFCIERYPELKEELKCY